MPHIHRLLLLFSIFMLSLPSALFAQEEGGGAQFAWFLYNQGLGVTGGAGLVADGHRLYATFGVEGNFALDAPFPAPLRVGVQWSYRNILQLWPEYFYFQPFAFFLIDDYGEGFKLDARWRLINDQVDLSLENRLFIGSAHLPVIARRAALYDTLTLSISLFRSTPIPDPEHSIFAELGGGVIAFLDSDDLAYGLTIRFPIELFTSRILFTPRIDYAAHNNGTLISRADAIGYSFATYSTFDRAAIVDFGALIRPSSQRQSVVGTLAFAANLEGRWYFLESLYLPGASDLYFKAFADLAYLADHSKPLDTGAFLYAAGGGFGYQWSNLLTAINIGYEAEVGFRFSVNLSVMF